MATLAKMTAPNGLPGWHLLAGPVAIGTLFDAGSAEPGARLPQRWHGVAPDGTRFGASSRAKLIQKLRIHAARRGGAR